MAEIVKCKLHTLFLDPKGVYVKYKNQFKNKHRFRVYLKDSYRFLAHGVLRPLVTNEDYDLHWNFLSFKDKKILDLGADYGSTASYFLWKGAKQVIAVEGDHKLASKLKENFSNNNKVITIEKIINDPQDIANLIDSYSPDIVKSDIEGAEIHLLGVPDNILETVNEWLIEAHSQTIYHKLIECFSRLGFNVSQIFYNQVKVVKAEMHDRKVEYQLVPATVCYETVHSR